MPGADIPRIHRLPGHLANRIAAGEVVERPASVVKELLENALDAGATEISVDIVAAGSGLIRVRDDGQGIHPEDLVLSLHRHATSKLSGLDDLEHIVSLGFRGEALASIASVSRFQIMSRAAGTDRGWCLGGEEVRPRPVAHPLGTTVEVRDLFYNTPARSKFLKSRKTEFHHIHALVRAMALSRCATRFKLLHEGRQVFHCHPAPAAPDQRAADVLGQAFLREAIGVEGEHEGMKLSGWVVRPEAARSQSDRQFFHVNGRLVRDRLVSHAIRQACADRVPPGRYVSYLLHLDMDPALVDVNVHPTKREVRFRSQRAVHDLLFGTLSAQLEAAGMLPGLAAVSKPAPPLAGARPLPPRPSRGVDYRHLQPAPPEDVAAGDADRTGLFGTASEQWLSLPNSRFALLLRAQSVWLFDVPAAREHLTRHELGRQLGAGNIPARALHMPLCFEVSAAEAALLEKHQATLGEMGLSLRPTAPQQLALDGFPECLAGADLSALFQDCLAWLKRCRGELGESQRRALCRIFAQRVNDALPTPPTNRDLQSLGRLWDQYHAPPQEKAVPWRPLGEADWQRLLRAAPG